MQKYIFIRTYRKIRVINFFYMWVKEIYISLYCKCTLHRKHILAKK